jgi:poly-gamma-glutamate synthesis protein (capsule biosynthesis protein)
VDYYVEEFAHRCIDAGADAVFGTGNHLLKGIEIYKGKPIFY